MGMGKDDRLQYQSKMSSAITEWALFPSWLSLLPLSVYREKNFTVIWS